jgi:putative autoinducer-2 (AI-2) aldolase
MNKDYGCHLYRIYLYYIGTTSRGDALDYGIANRLSRIFKNDGKSVMLAVDHGYFQGPTTGLAEFSACIPPLVGEADCVFITRGMLRSCINPGMSASVCLRVSGGPSILGELSREEVIVSVEEALRLNASAVGLSIFVGAPEETQTITALGKLVNEAERYGLPVMAVTAVGKDMGRDARYLGLACRIAAETGARFVKTYYCEDFEKVVAGCPVPIVIAGGKKMPEMEALQMTENAIKAGALGVDMGRNIFQSEKPSAMIKAVKAIVHNGATAEQAFGIFQGR